MNLARNVRIDVENPFFTTSRFVAAPAELTVGEMMIIVHAALGLEPAAPGILVEAGGDEPIDVLAIIDEDFFETFRDGAQYHPSEGAWNIVLSIADSSRVVMGLPALIAGEGPDLVSALGSAEEMFKVVVDVQSTMAYMAVPTDSMEHIFAHFPNYTLDQIHQRLTTFYPPAVAQRLATMGTEAANLEGGTKPALPGDLPLDPLHDELEQLGTPTTKMLEEWRAEIHKTYPELAPDYALPTLNDAIAAHVGQRIREYLEVIEEFPRLTGAGYLKQAAVARLKEGLNSPNDFDEVKREDYHQPLLNLRGFLTDLDWIKTTTTEIKLTKYGRKAMSDPLWATQVVLNNIPYAYAEPEGIPQLSFELVHLLRGEWEFNPEYDYTHAITRDLLFTLGVIEDDSTFPIITDGCEGFLGAIITKVREELNQELD